LVLVLGVSGESGGMPSEVARLVEGVVDDPRAVVADARDKSAASTDARARRAASMESLRAAPGVEAVVWLEEDSKAALSVAREMEGRAAPRDVERAQHLHTDSHNYGSPRADP